MRESEETHLEFWEKQARKRRLSGTQDAYADQLEQKVLRRVIGRNLSVLEAGCGDGHAANMVAAALGCRVTGFDFAPSMVGLAIKNAGLMKVSSSFFVHNLENIAAFHGKYDVIYTKRSLINLQSVQKQIAFMNSVSSKIKPGGKLVIIENSQQGLRRLNRLRACFGLPPIISPWHNLYIDEDVFLKKDFLDLKFVKSWNHSSMYYFISRVLYAKICQIKGREPTYTSVANKFGSFLPALGNFGQGLVAIWHKE